MYQLKDYLFQIPNHLIAQEPTEKRDESRLMLVNRLSGAISHHLFKDLPNLLRPGDVLVINNTKVIPARLYGRRKTGGKVEVLVLEGYGKSSQRRCLLKSRKKLALGEEIFFDQENHARILGTLQDGSFVIEFRLQLDLNKFLKEKGEVPLPPYISHPGTERMPYHKERYQTVYSEVEGSVAAPTAGLHFSRELLERIKGAGVKVLPITLHVGYGTFKPVRVQDIREHKVDPEPFYVPIDTAMEVENAIKENRRVICVGTTSVRTIETVANKNGTIKLGSGFTDLMIVPGYRFKAVSGIITNFHLSGTSLLFLVAAFMGLDLLHQAYEIAVKKGYRFYSYGDAMLIL